MTRRQRLRRIAAAAMVAAGITAGVIAGVNQWGGRDRLTVQIRLHLLASRDLGRLPARGTGAGEWCGPIGSLGAPDSCWQFGGAGTITDLGSNGWDLTATGSPRTGVVTGLPVVDGAGGVDFTGELGAEFDAATDYYSGVSAANLPGSDNLVSVTVVVSSQVNNYQAIMTHREQVAPQKGFMFFFNVDGKLRANVIGTTTNKAMYSSGVYNDSAKHCITSVMDGRSANAGRMYIDGADDTDATLNDLSGTGSWLVTHTPFVGGFGTGYPLYGAVSRVRIDYAALTLADHQALCGTYTEPLHSTHRAYADTTWTQSGGARCFQTGDHTATCLPGDAAGYTYDGADWAWAVERARINRVLYSSEIDCTNWTCGGTASSAAAVAPDGSLTAATLTVAPGANDIYASATGYTADASLYLRLWIKCNDTDTFNILSDASGARGDWDVDCSHATLSGGDWALIHSGHAAVTVNTAFVSDGAGAAAVHFDGSTAKQSATIWLPTLTETDGYSVIPTRAAAVDTGDVAWSIANASAKYWRTGDTVTQDLNELAGTCWVTGNPLYLSGAVGSECTGLWQELRIDR